jgi:hypothetical protein
MSYLDGNENQGNTTRPYSGEVWRRGLFMLLILFGVAISQTVLYAIALVQFLWMLFNGERNGFLAQFGRSLGLWLSESTRFLTGDTEDKPFPWRPWP